MDAQIKLSKKCNRILGQKPIERIYKESCLIQKWSKNAYTA